MDLLDISIEISGVMTKVGTIKGKGFDDARFSYDPDYLESQGARPVSVSLPLQKKAFTRERTATFFSGLLPEGFMGRRVSEMARVPQDDYLDVLAYLGRECLGAIKVTSPDMEEIEPDYIKLGHDDVVKLAGEGVVQASELVMKSHLSLTGASGKVGLYLDEHDGEWYLPIGDAPSTHIVKQSHIRLDGIVTNEQLSVLTAGKLGIPVPNTFIITTGGYHDSEILLATKRFDRVMPGASGGKGASGEVSAGRVISGHRAPYRLHQEDLAQALGIPASAKYEEQGGHYLRDVFGVITRWSSDPLKDQLMLWDLVVIDYLIGNTDNHIKNLSLLYSEDLSRIRLAPAYDILSTSIYESGSDYMAFSIGGDMALRDITRDSFGRAAEEVGLGKKIALKRFDALRKKFTGALTDAAKELEDKGFLNAGSIKDRILETGGISR